ncbi:hypothetical protein [uncultured Fibrella sp.]|uniref:hypothetical protein n=1 Tax=uncultured Fibrella sp. TaxID=1284596 RepID=UPI0035C9D5C8
MRVPLFVLPAFLCLVCLTTATAQNGDATVHAGLDAFAGGLFANYNPINAVLTANGYNALKPNSARFGVGGALCGPLTSKLPLRIGLQAMFNENENISGNNRTAINSLNMQFALELDVINKGAFLAGPLIGVGVLTSTIDASKDNQVGSFNGYVSGNARAISLNHLTFPLTFGGRMWVRIKNSSTKQYKRQGFALSGGYLLPLDGQNWYWANNVALPNGPNQNTGSWFLQVGFGVR